MQKKQSIHPERYSQWHCAIAISAVLGLAGCSSLDNPFAKTDPMADAAGYHGVSPANATGTNGITAEQPLAAPGSTNIPAPNAGYSNTAAGRAGSANGPGSGRDVQTENNAGVGANGAIISPGGTGNGAGASDATVANPGAAPANNGAAPSGGNTAAGANSAAGGNSANGGGATGGGAGTGGGTTATGGGAGSHSGAAGVGQSSGGAGGGGK